MNSVSDNQSKKLEIDKTNTIKTDYSATLTVPFDSNRQGEVFICSEDTNGLLESLPIFKGRMINSLGGGYNKLYIIQDTEDIKEFYLVVEGTLRRVPISEKCDIKVPNSRTFVANCEAFFAGTQGRAEETSAGSQPRRRRRSRNRNRNRNGRGRRVRSETA